MGEPKPQDSRTWVTVMIAVAVIGCIGVIGAALIGGLFEIIRASPSPQPPSTVVATTSPPNNPSPQSSVEPTNTSPAFPTETPIPLPTDTVPGTILDVGQTWRQGGLELTLVKAEPTLGFGSNKDTGPGVILWFSLTNRKPNEATIRYFQENFSAQDNNGINLVIGETNTFYGYWYDHIEERTFLIQSDEKIDLLGHELRQIFVRADIGDTSLTEILFSVSSLSNITNATWRIPVYH